MRKIENRKEFWTAREREQKRKWERKGQREKEGRKKAGKGRAWDEGRS